MLLNQNSKIKMESLTEVQTRVIDELKEQLQKNLNVLDAKLHSGNVDLEGTVCVFGSGTSVMLSSDETCSYKISNRVIPVTFDYREAIRISGTVRNGHGEYPNMYILKDWLLLSKYRVLKMLNDLLLKEDV